MQKKKKKQKPYSSGNCSRLSPCSFHNWRWTSREASLHVQESRHLNMFMLEQAVAKKDILLGTFERLRAFCERLCEYWSWKTIIDVVLDSGS